MQAARQSRIRDFSLEDIKEGTEEPSSDYFFSNASQQVINLQQSDDIGSSSFFRNVSQVTRESQ